jgi:hypothetical protein
MPSAAQREQGRCKRAGCSAQRAGVLDNRAGQGLHQGPIPWVKCYVQCIVLDLRRS